MISTWRSGRTRGALAIVSLTMALLLCFGLCSCGNSRYTTGTEKSSISTSVNRDTGSSSWSAPKQPKSERYVDPRWPTTNQELLSIPEEQRWYNAWGNVESTCTVVGPVVDVYQATDANGMPIFVNIGADYPDSDSVTLVIWADNEEDFDSTLHDIDHGNAWIAVTSYLTTYNDYLQFSSDNYVEWKYWTNVK